MRKYSNLIILISNSFPLFLKKLKSGTQEFRKKWTKVFSTTMSFSDLSILLLDSIAKIKSQIFPQRILKFKKKMLKR